MAKGKFLSGFFSGFATCVGASFFLSTALLVPFEDWGRWITHDEALSVRVERVIKPDTAQTNLTQTLTDCRANVAQLENTLATARFRSATLESENTLKTTEISDLQRAVLKDQDRIAQCSSDLSNLRNRCERIKVACEKDSRNIVGFADIVGRSNSLRAELTDGPVSLAKDGIELFAGGRVIMQAYGIPGGCRLIVHEEAEKLPSIDIYNVQTITIYKTEYLVNLEAFNRELCQLGFVVK